jgi:hypothetical protein
MKLEAKERLFAYDRGSGPAEYLKPFPFTEALAKLCTRIPNAGSGIDIYFAKGTMQGDQRFWFVRDGWVHGRATLENLSWATDKFPFKITRSPHIAFAKTLAGAGIARSFYQIILSRGISLATWGHSAQAEKLWDRLALLPGVNTYWFDSDGKRLKKNTPTALRVLTRETL